MSAVRYSTMASRFRAASLLLVAALFVFTAATDAADLGSVVQSDDAGLPRGHRPRVYIDVPPPDNIYDDSRGVYFYGKKRIDVPGSVTVNMPPYVCDVDGHSFSDKTEFVAHLRVDHGELLGKIADPFVVYEGQVHFVGK